MSAKSALLLPLLVIATSGPAALAQGEVGGRGELDLLIDVWEPGALPGFDVLGLSGTRVPGHLAPAFGLVGGYVHAPLVAVRQDSQRVVVDELVSHRWRLDVTAALGLLDDFAVSLALPVLLDQGGDPLGLLSRPGESAGAGGFGDLRLALRAQLFRANGFGLLGGVDFALPTGARGAFMTTRWVRVTPMIAADWYAPSGLGLVVNLAWKVLPERRVHNLVVDDGLAWGFGLVMPTPLARVDVRATLSGIVSTSSARDPLPGGGALDDDRMNPVELVAALGVGLGAVRVELGGGAGLSRGIGAPEFRGFLGVSWVPPGLGPERSGRDAEPGAEAD